MSNKNTRAVTVKDKRIEGASATYFSDHSPEKDYEFEKVSIQIEDKTFDLELSDTQGNAGIAGYRSAGYALNKDTNSEFRPTHARGIGRNLGLYHQAFLKSQSYQDAWGKIEQGLITSHWYIDPVKVEDPDMQEFANTQAKLVQKALFDIEGGWNKHIREALYMLIAGFAPFIKITNGLGQLVGLSFRYPSQVRRWLVDENQNNYVGIEFDTMSGDGGGTYTKTAGELLVYQFRAIGNDFEGISPMRSVYKFIEAHELFSQLEAVAAEKFGSPMITVERPVDADYDKVDDDALMDILDSLVATDNAVIILPGGYKVTVSSPQGQMPDFEPVKRYCDEKISTILQAEGSLIGLNGKGAYNLADIKDDQQLRSLAYYANIICGFINDKSSSGHASLIHDIVRTLDKVDGVDYAVSIDGQLPKLSWALSPTQDETNLEMIMTAFTSGALTKTEEDELWLRDRLKVPRSTQKTADTQDVVDIAKVEAINPDASVAATEAIAEGVPVSSTALNGAQVSSLVSVVSAVELGTLTVRSGIEILKLAFLMDEAQAARLLNVSPASAPQPGQEVLVPPVVE